MRYVFSLDSLKGADCELNDKTNFNVLKLNRVISALPPAFWLFCRSGCDNLTYGDKIHVIMSRCSSSTRRALGNVI